MASGKNHDRGVVISASALFMGAIATPISWMTVPAAIGCLIGGLYLSGDIDLGENKRFGPKPVARLKKVGLWWWWSPFQHFKHRHVCTHLPVLCTAIKVGWIWLTLYLPFGILWGVLEQANLPYLADLVFIQLSRVDVPITALIIGLLIADICHWAQDGCPINF